MRKSQVFAGLLSFALAVSGLAAQQVLKKTDPATARERLEREVRHELVMLPYYGVFDILRYQIEGNKVILSGAVTRPTLKKDAENVVKNIEAVESVENRVEVLPLSPNDDRIRRAAFRTIYGQDALSRYAIMAVPPIHIIVKDGNISLEGVVASENDKNVAGIQANAVSGAFSVKNNLQVEHEKQRAE